MKRTIVYEVTELREVEVDGEIVPDTFWRARKKIHKNGGKKVGKRRIKYIYSY